MFTGLDVTVLPNPWDLKGEEVDQNFEGSPFMKPYPKGFPDSVQTQLAQRYEVIFKLFLKHEDKISRVTFWGLHDGHSWRNGWAMIADVADFSEWKTGRRATAIIFSAMMVGLKLGLTWGTSLLTGILGSYGYDSALTQQSDSALHGIKLSVSIFPSIPFLLGIGLLFFYEINKKMEVKLEEELNQRRAESNPSQ